MKRRRSCPPIQPGSSSFTGFRFPPEVILLAVRWYLRFSLSYRDLEELLAERGVEVDHVTLYRWVQRFTPLLVDAARPCRHAVGDRWFVDETYMKVAGVWRYVYRAVDQYGQVIDVFASTKRDTKAATQFFATAIRSHGEPAEVTTDRAPALASAIVELLPAAVHDTSQYANNRVEADHGRLKARLRPMSGLKRDRTATHRRPRLHAEPPARPLRTRRLRGARAHRRRCVRRTRPNSLTFNSEATGARRDPLRSTQQRQSRSGHRVGSGRRRYGCWMRRLVTIAGPIGAGKSTVAELLGRRLANTGAATSLADLDEIAFAQRAQLDLSEFWRRAGVAHSGLVRGWFAAGADVVIAHGPFFESRSYDLLFDAAPEDALQHHVLLHVPFEIALRRVAIDPGRGPSALSQDREFLRATHERFRKTESSLPRVDIEIDTAEMSAADVADRLLTLLQGRSPEDPHGLTRRIPATGRIAMPWARDRSVPAIGDRASAITVERSMT